MEKVTFNSEALSTPVNASETMRTVNMTPTFGVTDVTSIVLATQED